MASILNLRGLTFPIKLEEKGTGTFESRYSESGEYLGEFEIKVVTPKIEGYREVLKTSINNIILFPVERRFYLPDFGTALPTIMKEPNDLVLEALIRTLVVNRIIEQEPRLNITQVIYTRDKSYNLGIDMKFDIPLDTEI